MLLGSCLFTVIVASLVLACTLAVQSILEAAAVPTFRLVATGNRPDLALAKGHKWHLFLSQCACCSNRRAPRHAPRPSPRPSLAPRHAPCPK